MKLNFKALFSLLSIPVIALLFVSLPRYSQALGVRIVSPATYTNGSVTNVFPLTCGDNITLPSGGTITFEVGADGDLLDNLYLGCVSLPPGASFPPVYGILYVHSTFTWTQTGAFAGVVGFSPLIYLGSWCDITFDWPLPVELSSFTSVINGNNVNLNWQTVSESNNARFDIERSSPENNWNKVGTVAGNGNSSTPLSYTFTDRNLTSGIYNYRLKQIDYNGSFEYFNLSNEVIIGAPDKFSLMQNYPNPFNPATNINYSLPADGKVSLSVFDMTGKEVQTLVKEFQTAGYYTVRFDGSRLSSGSYYYKLISGNSETVKKMILVK